MINLQCKITVKVTIKVKYAMALYHKVNVTRSTLYVHGKFHAVSKSAQLLHYATLQFTE